LPDWRGEIRMAAEAPPFNIAIPIYEGVDLMDVAAPYEIFN
jgi:predicted RNA-binding protein